MATFHLVIQGKVQGVFFRATAKEVANQYCLKGWIKNTESGDVEALISGTETGLKKFIKWCKEGPPNATVKNIVITKTDAADLSEDFQVIRS